MADLPAPDVPNPYAAPQTDISGDAVAPAFDLTREEVESYVGKKHRYYWGAWQRAGRAGGARAGFNGWAFFFNLFWLLYRKMFREFFVALGAWIAVAGGLGFVAGATGRDFGKLDRVVNLAVGATVGMLGNGLYLRRARRAIGAARAEEPDPERRAQLLARRGGTSILWALIGVVASAALAMLTAR